MKLRGSELLYQIVIYALVGLLLLFSVFPLIYVLGVSLTSEAEYYARGKLMVIPFQPTIAAYTKIFTTNANLLNSLLVSVQRTLIGTALGLSFTLLVGYGASRRDMPGSKQLMFLVLVTILFSGGMIPTFVVVKDLGLYDSFWSLIIPGLVSGWNALVFRQFFESLPHEVEEAAEIDGVSKLGMLVRIILPMSLPVVASLGLFTAVNHWNSWFDAMLYIKTASRQPLQLVLYQMHKDANIAANTNDMAALTDSLERSSSRSLRMALTVIGTVPILCVYPFLQKYFVKGVYTGAVKG